MIKRNSLGQQISSSQEGLENFWKWFGNSKVVDKRGRPIVVYHGSGSRFNEFDPKRGFNIDAIYHTAHNYVASHWAGTSDPIIFDKDLPNKIQRMTTLKQLFGIYKQYFNIEMSVENPYGDDNTDPNGPYYRLEEKSDGFSSSSPLGYTKDGINFYRETNEGEKRSVNLIEKLKKDLDEKVWAALNMDKGGIYADYLRIERPLEVNAFNQPYHKVEFQGKEYNTETIAAWAKENGFDGVIIRNVKETDYENALTDDYIVFDGKQVKSVDNNGKYGLNTKRIDEVKDNRSADLSKLPQLCQAVSSEKKVGDNNSGTFAMALAFFLYQFHIDSSIVMCATDRFDMIDIYKDNYKIFKCILMLEDQYSLMFDEHGQITYDMFKEECLKKYGNYKLNMNKVNTKEALEEIPILLNHSDYTVTAPDYYHIFLEMYQRQIKNESIEYSKNIILNPDELDWLRIKNTDNVYKVVINENNIALSANNNIMHSDIEESKEIRGKHCFMYKGYLYMQNYDMKNSAFKNNDEKIINEIKSYSGYKKYFGLNETYHLKSDIEKSLLMEYHEYDNDPDPDDSYYKWGFNDAYNKKIAPRYIKANGNKGYIVDKLNNKLAGNMYYERELYQYILGYQAGRNKFNEDKKKSSLIDTAKKFVNKIKQLYPNESDIPDEYYSRYDKCLEIIAKYNKNTKK